ncbi:MAG: cation:dicarboxylate symporter family transporter, partial [Gemmatirosa sp.]
MPTPSRRRSPTVLALVALVAGLVVGAATAATDAPALRAFVRLVEPLGTLWVNAIRMTLVPLVVSLLVTSVASVADVRAVGRLGARAVA